MKRLLTVLLVGVLTAAVAGCWHNACSPTMPYSSGYGCAGSPGYPGP